MISKINLAAYAALTLIGTASSQAAISFTETFDTTVDQNDNINDSYSHISEISVGSLWGGVGVTTDGDSY
jgi:hypothetical protein